MPDENREPEVKITDRRRFSAEGEPRDDGPEEPETPGAAPAAASRAPSEAAAPEPPPEAKEAAPLPPPTFEFLVLSFRWQAELQLGLYGSPASPEEKEPAPDLEGARHSIDLLGMLQEKTRGNLTLEEQRLLENSLTELRFRYVQAIDRFTKQKT
ncbi:MAG TPA: DUF1844 domain-containing protein [Bryobacterales bacterium]|nr:DUF1844 domain-containing protein [Bryobacterales bacterium]